jgi:hypothetical protein
MATSDGLKKRRERRAQPVLQPLEERALLSSGSTAGSHPVDTSHQFNYTTAKGQNVSITLYGVGSLKGTSLDDEGDLNLVISNTNEETGVIAKVKGHGTVPLESIGYAGVPPSVTGVGGTLINVVNLKGFDLVPGGRINLNAGVHTLFLNSIGPDTQVNLRELPESLTSTPPASSLPPAKTFTLTDGTVLAIGSATTTMSGQTLTYTTSKYGVQTLQAVSGAITAGMSLPVTNGGNTNNPLVQPAPPGVIVSLNNVNGNARSQKGLGDPVSFGYDATTNSLVAFDMTTGASIPSLTIANALPGGGNAQAGITLAQLTTGFHLLLIADGSNVYAYYPDTGKLFGHFATTNLASKGLANPTRLGTADAATVIADPSAGPNSLGLIQPINLFLSLVEGVAVPLGAPYASQNGFGLSGGLSGVNGTDTLYAVGGATFDRYIPLQSQLGITSLFVGPTNGFTIENTRGGLTNNQGNPIPSDTHGATAETPSNAVGSVDQSLAIVTGFNPGHSNTVTFYNPISFASAGSVKLQEGDLLTGLTPSYRPSLAGASLIDVLGNVQSFRAQSAKGLVLNVEGNLNLAKIAAAADTTIAGYPFGHAQVPDRASVTILSSTRIVAGRNGVVTVLKTPTGPLSLPD